MTTIGPAVGSDIVLASAEAADHRPRGPPHCAPPEPHAQLIIALDYSHWFPLQRLLRRTITRLFDHREICNGYRESLRGFFSRDAIIVWHVKSFKRKRRRIRQWRDDPAAPPVIRLTSARQAEKWLNGLREGALDF